MEIGDFQRIIFWWFLWLTLLLFTVFFVFEGKWDKLTSVSYPQKFFHSSESFRFCPDILFSSLRSLKPILRKQSWLRIQVWQQEVQIYQNTANKNESQCWFWADLVSNLYHNTPRMLKTFSIFAVSSQGDSTYWWKCFAFSLNGNLENSLVQGYSKQHSPLVLSYIVLDI